MALKVNTAAPDFSLPSTSGRLFTLSKEAAGKPLIIYFYPKDFTSVCTKEACEFRDSFEYFKGLDIDIYGISRDDIPTHQEFKKTYQLPFELLADEDGRVADLYDATVPLIRFTKRITYLLDRNHQVAGVYQNMFGSKRHIEEMIKKVNEKAY